MAERAHLSIGEVLSLLQDEFPDVTISKIRFLETQGLLAPERTPSGYRKFHDPDVKQLRWILREQKENFLPLKVIKDKLERGEIDFDAPASGTSSSTSRSASASSAPASPSDDRTGGRDRAGSSATAEAARRPLDLGPSGLSLTRAELAESTGLAGHDIDQLQRFGLIASRVVGADEYFDEDALVVAKLAARFRNHGLEARHLRMYKVAAEREAGLFEQVVMPLVKQREERSRAVAADTVGQLSELGDALRAAMLRRALRDLLGPG